MRATKALAGRDLDREVGDAGEDRGLRRQRLALLGAVGEEETPEVPRAVIDYAIRRAAVSAFFRQAEVFFAGIGRAYVDAFVHYLGLRNPSIAARGI